MAHITEDRILETSTTTGTGALTLAGAVTGFRTFASVMAVNDTCWYAAWGVDSNGTPTGEFESGLGTYSATSTFTRTTILESSAAGAAVTFSAGTKYVALSLTANKTAQFNNVGAMFMPSVSAEPVLPVSGIYLYAKTLLPGQTTMKIRRPSGVDSPIQDAVAFNRLVKWQGSGAALSPMGVNTLTLVGTPAAVGTAQGLASGSVKNQSQRVQLPTSATTAGALSTAWAGNGVAPVLRGNVAGEGGFRVTIRFALHVLGTNNLGFWGLSDQNAAPTVAGLLTQTSTSPGRVGLHLNQATGTWQIVNNITGTAPTVTNLGANFPTNITDLIELVLFCPPHNGTTAGSISYRVRRYTTSASDQAFEATGTLATNIPAATTILGAVMSMTNNATSGTVTQHISSLTIESDF